MYTFIVNLVRFALWLINGSVKVENKEVLPKESNYVLVAPHRSLIDPVLIALAGSPDQYSFMVKEELKENALLKFLIEKLNFVPVNREKPGPSALKAPIRILQEGEKSFMLFPTGSRYSDDLKNGAVTIAHMSGKPIVPAVYDGPYTIKDLFKRGQMTVRYGEPIYIDKDKKKEELTVYNQAIQDSFDQIQAEIDRKKKKK